MVIDNMRQSTDTYSVGLDRWHKITSYNFIKELIESGSFALSGLPGKYKNSYKVLFTAPELRGITDNLDKVDDYLNYNPSTINKLKDDLQSAPNKKLYIAGFIGGPLRKNELDELNYLIRDKADLFDQIPSQSLSTERSIRLQELNTQRAGFVYTVKLSEIENRIEIEFKSQDFQPPNNPAQDSEAYYTLSIKNKEGRIYGLEGGIKYDFVITKDGKLLLGEGHYYLSGEANKVLGAGRIHVDSDGKIFRINGLSGHYKPNSQEIHSAANILRDNGLTSTVFFVDDK